jgi:hypothetical protein
LGEACAFKGGANTGVLGCPSGDPPPIDPSEHDGDTFFVQSFFDVFFDITLTDVDPLNSYTAPLPPVLQAQNVGPAPMSTSYFREFQADAPNFNLIPPPESAPYIGHLNIEVPLGVDVNGNGELDKIKFQLATHSVDDEARTFIVLPNGTVVDAFDSSANLEGAVVDVLTDPPFSATLTGPTTAQSTLLNAVVPEPGALALIFAGGLLMPTFCRMRRQG